MVKEFANHKIIAETLQINYYFTKPYHSWERGSNENLNGLIRQYFPKGSEFTTLTKSQIKLVEEKLNNRPRKEFDFLSTNNYIHKHLKITEKLHLLFESAN